jgi:hypothetical protein
MPFGNCKRRKSPLQKCSGLSRKRGVRKKRGRKLVPERQRLTASAAFHGYRIKSHFEHRITDILTKNDEFMNIHDLYAVQPVAQSPPRRLQAYA